MATPWFSLIKTPTDKVDQPRKSALAVLNSISAEAVYSFKSDSV